MYKGFSTESVIQDKTFPHFVNVNVPAIFDFDRIMVSSKNCVQRPSFDYFLHQFGLKQILQSSILHDFPFLTSN